MDSFKVSLQLRKVKSTDKDGYIFIRVKLSNVPNPILQGTGYKIPARYWDTNKQLILPNLPSGYLKYSVEQVNNELDIKVTRLSLILKQEKDLSKRNVELLVKGGNVSTGSFTRFFYNYIESMRVTDKEGNTKVSPGYIAQYDAVYNSVLELMGEHIAFEDITADWLQALEKGLSKDLSGTTLSVKFKKIRGVIRAAIDRDLIKKKNILGYKWPEYKDPERPYLTISEVETIANKVYDGHWSDDSGLHKVACYFVIECFSGIRFSDWSKFRIETLIKHNTFRVRTKKNKQPIVLYLDVWPNLKRMLDYILVQGLVFDLTEQATNRMLKIIGTDIKLKIKLTTHVGRHTCATLLAEMGYTDSEGAEILGISPATFRKYRHYTRQGSKLAQMRHGGL